MWIARGKSLLDFLFSEKSKGFHHPQHEMLFNRLIFNLVVMTCFFFFFVFLSLAPHKSAKVLSGKKPRAVNLLMLAPCALVLDCTITNETLLHRNGKKRGVGGKDANPWRKDHLWENDVSRARPASGGSVGSVPTRENRAPTPPHASSWEAAEERTLTRKARLFSKGDQLI